MKSRYPRIIAILLLASGLLFAQKPASWNAGELQQALKKLSVMGSVLYIAAHPDDENTAVLSYLANEAQVRTAYLSLTRGDGGQNLIGPEIGDLLGVIRTQELLAARRIDGARQFFSRAVDFGYTKSRDEALQFWGNDEILADVVWVIRKFRPDVIITRFTPEIGGHGQHLASAWLAEKAFAAAGDPNRFPEQLALVKPWQPKRLLWDVWTRAISQMNLDTTDFVSVNVGKYNPLLGKSYAEIAALSRSMHKCQGFGASPQRGGYREYFQHTLGDPATTSLFDGVELSWKRVPRGEKVGKLLAEALENFQPQQPTAIIPTLLKARSEINLLPQTHDVAIKRDELDELLLQLCGIWASATVPSPSATPGSSVATSTTLINRNGYPVTLRGISYPFENGMPSGSQPLPANEPVTSEKTIAIPADAQLSNPYWLRSEKQGSLFTIPQPLDIGLPEKFAVQPVRFFLEIGGQEVIATAPVQYKWNDETDGESYRSMEILPQVTVNFGAGLQVFGNGGSRQVPVIFQSVAPETNATVHFSVPEGWQVSPASIAVDFSGNGSEIRQSVTVTPPAASGAGWLSATVETGGNRQPAHSLSRIDYDHIPIQTLTPPARLQLTRLDIAKKGELIGYIAGAGDDIPEALTQIGYTVKLLSDDDLNTTDLSQFDAIVAGIRAYNTRDRLAADQPRLLQYVNDGGTLVIQYNTSHRLVTEDLGPYPLKLSRDRVTLEDAPMEILVPNHPLLTVPNAITAADFEGWVQERGLYFPNEWDNTYTALFSSNDPGESPKTGSMLYATYGKGHYIYTGISFFRQLPAGVPGAFRLFVNLLSVGN